MSDLKKTNLWDMEARWHGDLAGPERRVLKDLLGRWESLGMTSVRLGKERSRAFFKASQMKVLEEARRRMLVIANLVEQETDSHNGAEALRDLAQGKDDDKSITLIEMERAVRREWGAKCAMDLNAMLRPEARLVVKLEEKAK